jgi:hypothetical protein
LSAIRALQQREEAAVQVGPAPLARAGVHVEAEEGVPVILGQLIAGQGDDLQPVLGVAALAADGLAAVGRQGRQEVVEGRVARFSQWYC